MIACDSGRRCVIACDSGTGCVIAYDSDRVFDKNSINIPYDDDPQTDDP